MGGGHLKSLQLRIWYLNTKYYKYWMNTTIVLLWRETAFFKLINSIVTLKELKNSVKKRKKISVNYAIFLYYSKI